VRQDLRYRTDEVSELPSQHKADERHRNSSAALCLVDRTVMQEEIYWTSLGGAAVNPSRHPLQPQGRIGSLKWLGIHGHFHWAWGLGPTSVVSSVAWSLALTTLYEFDTPFVPISW
jgi:hypothetical protein